MIGTMLIIEDDAELAKLIKIHMTDLGFDVESVGNGNEGLERAKAGGYKFIILDLQLPGMIGFDVCQRLRQEGVQTPILILTSRREEMDKVVALETGADDYLTKPFSVRELQARVRAILRRTEQRSSAPAEEGGDVIEHGYLRIDCARKSVSLKGKRVALTAKEFELLEYFAHHPGHVFNRNQLLESVWGYGYEGYEHTVNTTINRLRNKIEDDAAHPKVIVTVRGLGYKLVEAGEMEG
jgi:DNA-binding response OmpR family regulator